jgi:putative ABC transport system permease protein
MTGARDLLVEAIRLLNERPGRVLMSGMLVALAVACFVGLTIAASSSQAAVERTFEELRPRDLRVRSVDHEMISTDPLGEGDAVTQLLSNDTFDGGGRLWLHCTAGITTIPGGPSRPTPVFAADESALALVTGPVLEGHTTGDTDLPLAVITDQASDRLGLSGVPLPYQLQLSETAITVIGRVAAADRFPEYGGALYVAPTWAITSLDPDPDAMIAHRYRLVSPEAVAMWKELLPVALRPDHPDSVRVLVAPDPDRLRSSVSGDVQAIVIAVGVGFSLLGLFAIAANASAAVAERRLELGTKAALGWSPHRIVLEVLAETMLLGSLASSIGAAVGALTGVAVATTHRWPITAPWWLTLAASGAGAAAGAVAGAIPAHQAGSIDPAEVLRGS